MINVTTEYLDAIRQPNRRVSYRVTVGNTELTGDEIQSMEVEWSAGTDECISIGSTVASRLSLSLIRIGNTPDVIAMQKIVPEVGIEVDGAVQWVKLGVFYPIPAQTHKTDLIITAECNDRMTDFDGYAFESALTYPTTVGALVEELQNNYGVTIVIDEALKAVGVPVVPAESVRGVLSALGVLTGTFCVVDRDENIAFKTYTESTFELTAENYATFSMTSDDQCTISGLKCIVEDEEGEDVEILSGDASGVIIEIEGRYLTDQAQMDAIFGRCLPVTYQPYTLDLQGMPHIEAGDIFTLTDNHGVSRALYVVNHRLSMTDGGLKSEFSAAMPDTSVGTSGDGGGSGTFVAGGLIAQIQKMRADLIEAKKIVAGTVTADWVEANFVKTAALDADYARIDQANISKAWVEDLFVKGTFLTDDVNSATGSFSKYLTGVKIHGDLVEAETLKANTLILQGEDGIYRRLNIDALGQAVVDSNEKYNTGLDGSVLVADSVTANKINVSDLFAQDITSTGSFHMGGAGALQYDATMNELYIKVKALEFDTNSIDLVSKGTILARYQPEAVYLGMNSQEAVIDLCAGGGIIEYGDVNYIDNTEKALKICGDNAFLSGKYNAAVSVNYGEAFNNNMTGAFSNVSYKSYIGAEREGWLYLEAHETGETETESWDYHTIVQMSPLGFDVTSSGSIGLYASDGSIQVEAPEGVLLFGTGNGAGINFLPSEKVEPITALHMDSSGNIGLGLGLNDTEANLYLYGNILHLRAIDKVAVTGGLTVNGTNVSLSGHTHYGLWTSGGVQITTIGLDDGVYFVRPTADITACLGGSNYHWRTVYADILRTYDTATTSNGVAARIYSDRIYRYSSSSRRYKTDIEPISAADIDPRHLYNAEVVQFKYREGYLIEEDKRIDQLIPGFIVEDLEKVYPIAIDYNDDGTPEMWNANIIIPAMLQLIQEQNERIKELERKVQ